ncbi:hypothetical protein FXF46_16340 (plasmid) [Gluconobacter thailandicus]|uniref:Uncharacterized protein n=1 Tax=Gluconobacter thailandicus TaxID=257438 RepID=A0AAP9EV15_GLUTH|nr:hypothetical protein FXF46_16340 [Gluconobacter thailandicus]
MRHQCPLHLHSGTGSRCWDVTASGLWRQMSGWGQSVSSDERGGWISRSGPVCRAGGLASVRTGPSGRHAVALAVDASGLRHPWPCETRRKDGRDPARTWAAPRGRDQAPRHLRGSGPWRPRPRPDPSGMTGLTLAAPRVILHNR